MSEQTSSNASASPTPKTTMAIWIKVAIGVAIVIAFLVGGFMLFSNNARSPEVVAEEETARAVQKIGRLIALPEGEVPTLATVADPNQLKDQPFFAKAEPGFQVLLYPVAQKAFLYNPQKDIIVEVATLNLGQ